MLSLEDLRNNFSIYYDFYISAKERSFSEAGRKYFITPSSLTRSVAKLEDLLDLKLVNTSNTGFELTLDGERLQKKLNDFFDTIDNYQKQSELKDTHLVLTIGMTRNISDYTFTKYLIHFNRMYPDVQVNIITDGASNLNDYLVNHKIDVLIDYLPHINSTEKHELEIVPFTQYRTCFACSRSYYKKISSKVKSLKDLKNFKLIIPGSSRRRQGLDEVLQQNGIELQPLLQMPDSRLMSEMVKANDFIGYFIEDELADFDLVELKLVEMLPSNAIGVIYPKRTINAVARNFVNSLLNYEGV